MALLTINGGVFRRMRFYCKMITRLNFLFPSAVSGEKPLSFSTSIIYSSCSFASSFKSAPSIIDTNNSVISRSGKRVSRVLRIKAQEALFDYLHYTRNFHAIDAEHISRNSPYFLKKLLASASISSNDGANKCLTKFFRYNPINEFEPFFESLGLSPAEFQRILPRELMFLSDDPILLDNFHVLCDYGVPRGRIGRIYKEANELFRLDSSLLYLKFGEYEKLGLSKSTVVKLVSACPRLLVGSIDGEFVELLGRLTQYGLRNDWIGGRVRYVKSYSWKNMLHALDYLSQAGYDEKQIQNFLKKNPAILFESSGRRILILIGLLLKFDIHVCDVLRLFLDNPDFLSQKFSTNLWQSVGFFFTIGMGVKNISWILSMHVKLLGSNSLMGPRTVLKRLKISKGELCHLIEENLEKFISFASASSHNTPEESEEKLADKSRFLLSLGYVENSDEMLKDWKKFRGRGDELQERFDCLVEAGLNFDVAANMVKRAPSVLNQKKDALKKKIEVLKKLLGYPPESIIRFPTYLAYDIKRINCRLSMYAWLTERGAAKPMLSLGTLLACSDKRFVEQFVNDHPDGPRIWESLKATSSII